MNPDQSCQRDLSKPGGEGARSGPGRVSQWALATFHPFPASQDPASAGPALALTLSGPHPAFPTSSRVSVFWVSLLEHRK